MWEIVGKVSSGITLCAFIFAVAVNAYKSKIQKEELLIRAAPESDRGKLKEKAIEGINIDANNLTKTQKYDLLLKDIELRSQKLKISALILIIITILTASIAVFAIYKTTNKKDADNKVKKDVNIVNVVVSGMVDLDPDGEPLRSAQIIFDPLGLSTYSKGDGSFSKSLPIPHLNFPITVSVYHKQGYPYESTVNLSESHMVIPPIRLKKK